MKEIEIDILIESSSGGAGRHAIDLFNGIRARGWPARIILSPLRIDESSRSDIDALPKTSTLLLPMRRAPHWSDAGVICSLRSYFRKSSRRHLLHAHSTKAGFIGAALRPWLYGSVLTPHAYRGMDANLLAWKSMLIRNAERTFSYPYDLVIGVSQTECAYAEQLGIPNDRIRYIPNGVNCDYVARAARSGSADRTQGPVVGFVGRLTYQKNPGLFLQTFAEIAQTLGNARALIVGDGPLLQNLKGQAADLGIAGRIQWAGSVRAIEYLGKMDILVHTSLYESHPYVLLEAAAAALPIVSVCNQGSVSILSPLLSECLVPSSVPADLAARVLLLLKDKELRQKCIDCGSSIASSFSMDAMVDRITREYELLL